MTAAETHNSRRTWWRWLLAFAGVCLAPMVLLLLVVLTYVGLDGDAASLRRSVVVASGVTWHCRGAVNLGASTLGAMGYGLRWLKGPEVADAQRALRAVKRASVGVYERSPASSAVDDGAVIAAADRAMGARGWQRLAVVRNLADTVMIYTPEDAGGEECDVGLAVLTGAQLIVVSARLDGVGLAALLDAKLPLEFSERLRLAQTFPRRL